MFLLHVCCACVLLGLRGNKLEDAGALAIAKVRLPVCCLLPVFHACVWLSLQENELCDAGALALANVWASLARVLLVVVGCWGRRRTC